MTTHTENSNWPNIVANFNGSWDFNGLCATVLSPANTIAEITINEPLKCTAHSLWVERNGKDFKVLRIHDRSNGVVKYQRVFTGEEKLRNLAFNQ